MQHILIGALEGEILGSEAMYLYDGEHDKDVLRIQKGILENNGIESGGLAGISNKFLRIIKSNVLGRK
jgi:hypothetical protein